MLEKQNNVVPLSPIKGTSWTCNLQTPITSRRTAVNNRWVPGLLNRYISPMIVFYLIFKLSSSKNVCSLGEPFKDAKLLHSFSEENGMLHMPFQAIKYSRRKQRKIKFQTVCVFISVEFQVQAIWNKEENREELKKSSSWDDG